MSAHDNIIKHNLAEIEKAEKNISDQFIGRTVRVLSRFNGQMFGRSKKPLTGRTFKVTHVSTSCGRVHLLLEGTRVYIERGEIEFADDNGEAA